MASRRSGSTLPRAPTRVLPPRACKSQQLPPPSQVCHFLRIPPEIRCMIYRYLLEPEEPRILVPKMIDLTLGTEMSRTPIHTAILRTNRQIYSEVSFLMYSELILELYPGDIVCLRPNPDDLRPPSKGVWRHNPLEGIGVEGLHGERIYDTPEMDGKMEPHVFARFEHIRIELDLEFNQDDIPGCPELVICPDLQITPESCVKFQEYLYRTNILTDLAKVISNSRWLTFFEINLWIAVDADEDYNLSYNYTDSNDLPDIYWLTVHTRGAEIFIESGVMDPVRKLTNVDLAIVDAKSAWGDLMSQPKLTALREELEDDIQEGRLDPSDTGEDSLADTKGGADGTRSDESVEGEASNDEEEREIG